ncbi:pyruvate dehydrogenase (acetyl-transferring) E1 component subunit alpha [Cellulosimicrobium cellulans]|uniref:pyruvate dehydrogenase (acetyl-transferring) E1 component subunit alpha n=1 Tax=Cellulosimicrobium cellulans TaxID=1710 RepID=UPI001965C06A|nr:pyruvate dehydrogenase (acetyl-transferring) E1 component subunit alpha [Cellulosimicrobium cellulans]MBN0038949.1 pyruvate dehydrogenase (acetyl-transferring) E1 component subunit alpha [Cellulosimicrobium cellulans]
MPSEPAVRTGPTAATPPKAYDGHRAATPRDARADRKNATHDARGNARTDVPPDARTDVPRRDPGDGASTPTLRVLTEDGTRLPDPELDRWLADLDPAAPDDDARETARTTLLRLFEDMVVARRIDAEATALQRQGELALWPPLLGQEAAQVGSARALRDDDFVFSSYREHAVARVRGAELVDLVRVWRGVAVSGWDPYAIGMASPQVIIGAQTLHATGWAMGVQNDVDAGRVDASAGLPVGVAYFGDGAMSQGDVNEAFVFASTYRSPVVFFCQNNQWAISEPVALQSRVPLAERARGFGMPGVRVDGNDVLAVLAVTRAALDRARHDGGPTLVEAVTYRMGPHTTADDPKRYRDAAEVEEWTGRDPIARFEAYLRSAGVLDDAEAARVQGVADAAAAELRAGCVALADPPPLSLFDHVYAEPHHALERERAEYAHYLAGFGGDDGPAGDDGAGGPRTAGDRATPDTGTTATGVAR